MISYKYLINKNNLKVNKITFKGNFIFLDTPLGLFVIKTNENIKTYDYLLSRGFNYFPKIIDYDNSSILYKMPDGIEYDINEKALDFIRILSLLNNKTSYYKNINNNENNTLYNSLKTKIEDLMNYYDNLISSIEDKEYYSPSEYLIIRNSSMIISSLNYSYNLLKEWHDKEKDNNKIRVSTIYNNYDLNTLIKTTDDIYLTNFENSYIDRPVIELVNFYNKYYMDFDFVSLIRTYEKVFKLQENEIDLLIILSVIPEKIEISDNINDIYNIKLKINKLYRSLDLLKLKETENTTSHKKKDNK